MQFKKSIVSFLLVTLRSISKMERNYHQEELTLLAQIDPSNKPSLLLHSCCGPCNAYPILYLSQYFKITLYFNNSNIYPESEYHTRLQELEAYVSTLNAQGYSFGLVVEPYDYQGMREKLVTHASDREGQTRCSICFETRMKQAFTYANAHEYEYFTTVMSVSRQKNSKVLNQIGERLQPLFSTTKYFFSDFKKNNGNGKSNEIAKQCGMYRQTYCGCEFSIRK